MEPNLPHDACLPCRRLKVICHEHVCPGWLLALQSQARKVEKCPEAQWLLTHPGVGPLTALAFVLIIGTPERFGSGKPIASYLGR